MAHEGIRMGFSQEGHYISFGILKECGLRDLGQPIQEGLAQIGHDGGLKKARALEYQSLCVESKLIEAIIGVALWVEE